VAAAGVSARDNYSFRVLGANRFDPSWQEHGFLWTESGSYSGRMGVFEFGFSGLRVPQMGYAGFPAEERGFMDVDMARSFHFTFNIATLSVAFNRAQTLGMTLGAGLTVNDYAFQNKARIGKSGNHPTGMPVGYGYDVWHPIDTGETLKKSKLNTVAIHIPLALEVSPSRDFFFSVGCFADLIVASHFKSKFPKEKLKDAETNFGQFGVTGRVGFRGAYLFANYGFADLINYRHGPELRPWSFGVGFGF
jgi:hypothetical protein